MITRISPPTEGFGVVGFASAGSDALSAIVALRQDNVLLDIRLPGRDAFAIAEQLARLPDPPTV
jgi:CheY-like chemotaxis protein